MTNSRKGTKTSEEIDSDDPRLKEALNMLKNWNKKLSVDSSSAALFEVWYHYYLQNAIVKELVSNEAADAIGTGDPVVVLDLIGYPDSNCIKYFFVGLLTARLELQLLLIKNEPFRGCLNLKHSPFIAGKKLGI